MAVNDGFILSASAELGLVLIASRDFAIGDEVLREEPFISYKSMVQAIQQYQTLSMSDKTKFMEFYHRDSPASGEYAECASLLRGLLSEANDLHKLFKKKNVHFDLSIETIFKILSVLSFNSHAYQGVGTVFCETTIPAEGSRAGSALFYLASKVAHSCEPNLMYTSKRVKNSMSYFALKDIKAGDMLTFNYILESDTVRPTPGRRLKLRESKDFNCCCSKCTGPDFSRGMKCSAQGCRDGIQLCTYHNNGIEVSDERWLCNRCGSTASPSATEAAAVIKFRRFAAAFSKARPDLPLQLEKLMEENLRVLSPTHYIMCESYMMLSTLHASSAAVYEQVFNPRLCDMSRLAAAGASLRAVQIMECVANNCLGGGTDNDGDAACGCPVAHIPHQSGGMHMFFAAMDLVRIRRDLVPDKYAAVIGRYLPLMRINYGDHDEDVHKIADFVQRYDHLSPRVQTASTSVGTAGRQQQPSFSYTQSQSFASAAADSVDSVAAPVVTLTKCGRLGCTSDGDKLCGKCKSVGYCSRECRVSHWRQHKKVCGKK